MILHLDKKYNFVNNDPYKFVSDLMEYDNKKGAYNILLTQVTNLVASYNQLLKNIVGSGYGISKSYWKHVVRFPADYNSDLVNTIMKVANNKQRITLFGMLMLICYDIRTLESKHMDSITWSK